MEGQMTQRKKMKMCANCEGSVDWDVMICPYCGNNVIQNDSEVKSMKKDDALSTLYPPPYKPSNVQAPQPQEMKEQEVKKQSKLASILPTLLFSLGVNVLLFGLFLLIFSKNGELLLRWDTSFWYIYVLLGLPFIFVSYKKLSKS